MRRRFFQLVLASALILAFPSTAGAVAVQGVVHNVPYVIGFRPMHSNTQPYLGQMSLNFNNGVISGRYTDVSIKPCSPFANAVNIPVSGGVSEDHLTLIIRQVTFRGTLKGEWMSGSATIRGGIFVFEAEQGAPGSGRQ